MPVNRPQPHDNIQQFDPSTDVLRLLHFFNALEELEGDPQPSTEAHVLSQMKWRGHDPANDRWVIEHPDNPANIIGHAWIFTQTSKRAACKIAVHPYWQRQGLGSTLLPYILQRAHELGVVEIVSGCDAANEAAVSFLERHGFQVRSSNWFLHLPQSASVPEPVWPSGYSVRRYIEVDDLPLLVEVLNRSFHDIPGHAANEVGVVTVESVSEMLGINYLPEHLFLAFAPDNTPAGVCRLRLHGFSDNHSGFDIVDAPGIVPEHREQNLHVPLILTAVHWQRKHSKGDLMLESYGDSEVTIAAYEALGFQLRRRYLESVRSIV